MGSAKNITIKVILYNDLKHAAGLGQLELSFAQPIDVMQLMERLVDMYGPVVIGCTDNYAWRHGSEQVVVIVNGRTVAEENRSRVILEDGSEVCLLPPLGGG